MAWLSSPRIASKRGQTTTGVEPLEPPRAAAAAEVVFVVTVTCLPLHRSNRLTAIKEGQMNKCRTHRWCIQLTSGPNSNTSPHCQEKSGEILHGQETNQNGVCFCGLSVCGQISMAATGVVVKTETTSCYVNLPSAPALMFFNSSDNCFDFLQYWSKSGFIISTCAFDKMTNSIRSTIERRAATGLWVFGVLYIQDGKFSVCMRWLQVCCNRCHDRKAVKASIDIWYFYSFIYFIVTTTSVWFLAARRNL